MLTLEQVNRLHPLDAEARRRLAAFYERAGQRESLSLWREAVELAPDHQASRLGLARTAIRFGDRRLARETLDQIEPDGIHQAEHLRLLAALALLERDGQAQEENLSRLAELEPGDERVALNLATIRLADPHGPKAGSARATLLGLARKDRVRMRAVAELLGDVARRWPTPSPEREAALQHLAGALTPPRGPVLAMPSQVDHVDRLVRYAMTQPAPEAEDVISLANWMSLNGQSEAALLWIESLPPRLTGNPLLRAAQAEFAVRARDWDRLHQLLLAGAWGPVPTETIAQAFRVRDRPEGAQAAWQAALDAAKASPPGLRTLLRLAELWELADEQRQVLLVIARGMPHEAWAWRRLIGRALAQGDSEQVWQTYREWQRAVPGDPLMQAETALMGFLLGRRSVPAVTETAGYLAQPQPGAGAAVAHALALWRAGRAAEAAAVLDARPRTDFAEPRHALARGVVLAAAGRATESDEMLDTLGGVNLLTEEKALVAEARERNRRAR